MPGAVLSTILVSFAVAAKPSAMVPFLIVPVLRSLQNRRVDLLLIVPLVFALFTLLGTWSGADPLGWIGAIRAYPQGTDARPWAILVGPLYALTIYKAGIRMQVVASVVAMYFMVTTAVLPVPNLYSYAPLVLFAGSPVTALLGASIAYLDFLTPHPVGILATLGGTYVAMYPWSLPVLDRWCKAHGWAFGVGVTIASVLMLIWQDRLLPASLWASDVEHFWYCAQLGSTLYDPARWLPGLSCVYGPAFYYPFAALGLPLSLVLGKLLSVASIWRVSRYLGGDHYSIVPFLSLPLVVALQVDNAVIWLIALVTFALPRK